MSIINTAPVTMPVLKSALLASASLGFSSMIWGDPGIGKTSVVHEIAREMEQGPGQVVDVRLPIMDPQDIGGITVPDIKSKTSIKLLPDFLPRDGHGIIFLDEITGAHQLQQVAAYGLLQERRVGSYKIPDSWWVIAAGNHAGSGAIHHEMGTALADRLVHFKLISDVDAWLKHGETRGYHPAVRTFIRVHSDYLSRTKYQIDNNQTVGCTPRSWERVSDVMHRALPQDVRKALVDGIVGEEASTTFDTLLADIASAAKASEILAMKRGRERTRLLPTTIAGAYNLIYAMRAEANSAEMNIRALEVIVDYLDVDNSDLPIGEIRALGTELLLEKAHSLGTKVFDEVIFSQAAIDLEDLRSKFKTPAQAYTQAA